MPVIDKLRCIPFLCDVPGYHRRQFYPVVFRVQVPVWEDKILNPKLAIVLVHFLRLQVHAFGLLFAHFPCTYCIIFSPVLLAFSAAVRLRSGPYLEPIRK